MAAPETPETPLVAGPLYGLRTWSVVAGPDGERLAGPQRGTPWPAAGEWLEASCSQTWRPPHEPPGHDCICGVHAWHPDTRNARQVLASRWNVPGVVECSGRVEVHPEGFRAQRGRPHALVVAPGRHRAQIERVARAYDAQVVEVRNADELVAWCRERRLGLDEPAVDAILGAGAARAFRRDARRRTRTAALRVAVVLLIAALLALAVSIALPEPDGPRTLRGRGGEITVR